MKHITSRVTDEAMENAKLNRESILNPPDMDPGMFDEEDDGWGSLGDSFDSGWGGSSGFGDENNIDGGFGGGFGVGGDGFGDGFGGGFGGGGFGGGGFGGGGFGGGGFGGGFGSQPPGGMQGGSSKNAEDKFWEAIAKGGKGSFNFLTELIKSFSTFDTLKRMHWGRNVIISGLLISLLSLLGMILKVPSMVSLLVGSLISVGIGVPIFMISLDDISSGKYMPAEQPQPDFDNEEEEFNIFEAEPVEADYEEDDIFSGIVDDFDGDSLFESAYDLIEEDDVVVESVNPTEVLDKLNSNMGMITRQYLYETVNACMIHKRKDFSRVIDLPEDSREFLAFCTIIEQAAENLRTGNQETMPQLLTAKDKLFYTQLEISRVKWIKNIQPLIDEIVNMCRFDEETGRIDENIFGYGHSVGDKMYIKIVKGETAMVTIRDAYHKVSKDILDTSNYMPVVFGIDEEGEVVWRDLKKINSMLVTGMPRSGKSWFIKAVLAQMMFYLKPSDLHFYLLDPKGDISDFKSMHVPHIRKFVSTDDAIVRELRWIVKTEADRRRKIMKEAGNFIDFWDLKKKRPDIELPLLYVVIDEVVTLAERMDKETKEEFQGLLTQLVSQLPALGIRIFMVPHVVKDQILKKTITDLIPCRISVCGDPLHIESTTGTKPKDFNYKLTNQGDMAVRLGNEKTKFVHGVVITDTNDGTEDFFDFLANMWMKIDPESVEGSKYEQEMIEEGKVQKKSKVKVEKVSKQKESKSVVSNELFNGVDVEEVLSENESIIDLENDDIEDDEDLGDIDLWA